MRLSFDMSLNGAKVWKLCKTLIGWRLYSAGIWGNVCIVGFKYYRFWSG